MGQSRRRAQRQGLPLGPPARPHAPSRARWNIARSLLLSNDGAFLRENAGATDHAAAAGYGLPAGAIGYGLAEFALNPATGLSWDTGDLTGFEYGLEAV